MGPINEDLSVQCSSVNLKTTQRLEVSWLWKVGMVYTVRHKTDGRMDGQTFELKIYNRNKAPICPHSVALKNTVGVGSQKLS